MGNLLIWSAPMFNPERILGKMIKSSFRSASKSGGFGGLGSSAKGAMTMGALGVAFAAFDHFANKPAQGTPVNTGSYTPPPSAPPPQTPNTSIPPTMGATMPPPPPGAVQQEPISNIQEEAVLLIQAMIASANADGVLDAQERQSILDKLQDDDLSIEEKQFISQSFLSPPSMDDIVSKVNSPDLAKQVYAVSLITITVDTDEERNYLQNLAQKLKLSESDVHEIHSQTLFA